MGMTEKQDAESVGFVPKGNEAAAPVVKRVAQGAATTDLDKNGATLRVAGLKDNNNTTSPTAWQTDPWYDRPKLRDKSSHKDVRDPLLKTGVPQDDFGQVKKGVPSLGTPENPGGGKTLPERKPKPSEKDSFLAKGQGG
jgi:hypothetical protein